MRIATKWLVAGLAAWTAAALAWGDGAASPAEGLRHAVACPPFKGPPELASRYHAELVRILRETDGVEYLEGSRALARRAPEFSFRVQGQVVESEEGGAFVTVALVDMARKEQIASLVAPASDDPEALAAWRRTIQDSIRRRAERLPFECRIRRQQGQNSFSLDRGLGAGLRPGMVLLVATDEEKLLSPFTGEVVGRDVSRAIGQIEIFRVMENSAYARPAAGTKLPRTSNLYARTF